MDSKRIPVTVPALGSDPLELVVSLHFPSHGVPDDATVLVCWPGGSYTRRYWDFPEQGYNFGEYAAEAGFVVVSVDPLGVGESSHPDNDGAGLEAMAAAAADLTRQLKEQLIAGTLDPQLEPIREPRLVGVGHSMGGVGVTVQQALFASYDAVAILGNAVHIRDSSNDGIDDYEALSVAELIASPAGVHVREGAATPSALGLGYVDLDRAMLGGFFHLPDVPTELIAKDDALAASWPRRSIAEVSSGRVAKYAPLITVPVFLAFGDVDLSMTPHNEVAHYSASSDVTVFKLAGSAHCHNFASTRTVLWDRIAAWV